MALTASGSDELLRGMASLFRFIRETIRHYSMTSLQELVQVK